MFRCAFIVFNHSGGKITAAFGLFAALLLSERERRLNNRLTQRAEQQLLLVLIFDYLLSYLPFFLPYPD